MPIACSKTSSSVAPVNWPPSAVRNVAGRPATCSARAIVWPNGDIRSTVSFEASLKSSKRPLADSRFVSGSVAM
jgi:hypothetical protein